MPHEYVQELFTLVDIPAGKRYLADVKAQTQSAQKGGVCWYNTYNLIRPRVGKKLAQLITDDLKYGKPGQAITELLELRKIEQIISQYRKNIERRYLMTVSIMNVLEQLDSVSISKTYQLFLNYQLKNSRLPNNLIAVLNNLKDLGFNSEDETVKAIIQLFEQFLDEKNCTDFYSYAEIVRDEDIIFYSEQTCKLLGIENEMLQVIAERAREVIVELVPPHLQQAAAQYPQNKLLELFKKLPISTRSAILSELVVKEFAKKYRLISINWNPTQDGFLGLVEQIKKYGALIFGVKNINLDCYDIPPQNEGRLNNYEVFSWPNNAKLNTSSSVTGHAVTIVGTQRIKNKQGAFEDFVLFMDPNDESKTDENRKVYRISYDVFTKNVKQKLLVYGSNHELLERTTKLYQIWEAKHKLIQRINYELQHLEPYKNSQGSFWVNIGLIEASDAKIVALESLRTIIHEDFLENGQRFHETLVDWKSKSSGCIASQRNKLHRFFAPSHQATSAKMVNEFLEHIESPDNGYLYIT